MFSETDPEWARECLASGLSSGEGLIESVRDADGEHDGVADKRMLVSQGEFSSVLRVMDRDGNTLVHGSARCLGRSAVAHHDAQE